MTEYRQAEITRRRSVAVSSPMEDAFVQDLANAADQYIVTRGDQKTVISGYHWFSDWGRDTSVSQYCADGESRSHVVAPDFCRA